MKVKFANSYKEWAEQVSEKEKVPVPFDLEGTYDAIYIVPGRNGILVRFNNGGMVVIESSEDYEIVKD